MSVKVVKFEIKVFRYILLYKTKTEDKFVSLHLTNGFYFAGVCSAIEHKGRHNVVRTAEPRVPLLFLPHFDVICDLLLNRRTATMESIC